MPARRGSGLSRAAAAFLRTSVSQRTAAPALPGPLQAHPDRRIPGHQHAAVPLAEAVRGAARGAVRGGRRRPVNLRLSRRQHRQHGRVRARIRARQRDQAGAELPQPRPHPHRGQHADRAERPPPRQESVDSRRRRRADPYFRGLLRPGRGELRGRRSEVAQPRRREPVRHGALVSLQRAVAGAGTRAVLVRRAVPGVRWAAFFRAPGNQARARLPASADQPGG